MSSPLVSIIIPYYNKKDTINRSVYSVLNQTYTNWELIIIDDFGIDRLNVGILPKDVRIKTYFNDVNLGAGQTREKGQEFAKGEYVAFLDADDWWDERFLSFCLGSLKNKNCAGCFVDVVEINGNLHTIRSKIRKKSKIRETIIQHRRPWQTSGILWKREVIGSWGKLKTHEDAWFEINNSHKFNELDYVAGACVFHPTSGTNNLSSQTNKGLALSNTREVYNLLFRSFWNSLSLRYKIILLNRILRCNYKIVAHHKQELRKTEHISSFKMYLSFIRLFVYENLLGLTHKLLQMTPFKINWNGHI